MKQLSSISRAKQKNGAPFLFLYKDNRGNTRLEVQQYSKFDNITVLVENKWELKFEHNEERISVEGSSVEINSVFFIFR